jgi:hypothetical protein
MRVGSFLAILVFGAGVYATEAKKASSNPGRNPGILVDDAAVRQAQLKRLYGSFKEKLALLANRFEAGNAEEMEKAKALRAALKLASEKEVEGKFDAIVEGLRSQGAAGNTDVLAKIIHSNKELRDDLKKMIALLTGLDGKDLKARRKNTENLLARLKEVRNRQARLLALTERGRQKPETLRKPQESITEKTRDLAKADDWSKLDLAGKPGLAARIRGKINQAVGRQASAQGKLGKGDGEGAAQEESEAVGRLDEAIREAEEVLTAIREEEREQSVAALKKICERMLRAQVTVRDGTLAIDATIQNNGRASLAEIRKTNALADLEESVVKDADKGLSLLENEDKSVAFVEAFRQVHKDAGVLKIRLNKIDTGKVTVTIENDVIETLKEMIAALKKQTRRNPNPNTNPPRPPSNPPKPPLVNGLAELKLLAALQRRVNQRTTLYGNFYPGEQATMAGAGASKQERELRQRICIELTDLAGRQKEIGKVAHEMAIRGITDKEPQNID